MYVMMIKVKSELEQMWARINYLYINIAVRVGETTLEKRIVKYMR